MKKAWIKNGVIHDIAHSNPVEIYHPDVAVFYDTDVPDHAENGDLWANGVLSKPEPPPRLWFEANFREKMTLAEKTKWNSNSLPEITTAKLELPKARAGATEIAEFLVSAGAISQDTANKILA